MHARQFLAALAASLPLIATAQVLAPASASGSRVGLEAVAGSRDAGAYGRHGQELRASWQQAGDAWTFAAGAGVARDELDDRVHSSWAGEARHALGASGMFTGVGLRLDYDATLIPSAHLGWVQPDTAYPFAAALTADFPRGSDRDAADLRVTAGQGFACGTTLRCAFEFAGEDLEGFFEAEAEGGARLVLGPSLAWPLGQGRELTLLGGWIHAATQNAPTRPGYAENRDGVMVRVGVRLGE